MTTSPEQNALSQSSFPEPTSSVIYNPSDHEQNTTYAVVARDLVQTFGQKVAVNHLNLAVRHGEFFGFLGPNGAGKSTTIKMMTGLLRPTAGTVWVDGIDV